MKNKNWTLRYSLINVFYFVAFATIHGFAAVFLLNRGFSNTEVGIALALANILSVIGQPIVAGIVDRSRLVTNRRVLMAAAAIMLFGSLALSFLTRPKALIFVLFVLIYTVQFIAMSFLIAISFEYRSAGCKHHFGLARGLGSASFAVTAAIMGPIIEEKGPGVNMCLTVAVMVLMFAVVFFFRLPDNAGVSASKKAEAEDDAPTNNFIEFVKKYPMFMLFMLGVSCVFFSHNMLNDYLIQIIRHLGGGETELGYAQFLQAILELPVMALMVFVLRKINAKAVLMFSMTAFLVKVVIMYLATGLPGMYASQSIQFFAYSVFIPTSAHYADKLMKGGDKVKGQAYINSAITLGGVFSNIVCGPVLDRHGVPAMLMVGIATCLVGTAISVVALAGKKRGVKNETF
ncbi:MAG: MFS transporter [Lachnospiraceae bacterium]|nr:MFS transporter [Lachnospiraceae bacterium]